MSLQSKDYRSDYEKLLDKYNKLESYTKNLEKDVKELNRELNKYKKENKELYFLAVAKVDREVRKSEKHPARFC